MTTKEPKYCEVCGNLIPSGRGKLCSDECRKIHYKNYNTKYIKSRRESDPEFVKKTNEWSAHSNRRAYARKMWQTWLDHAEKILQLAQEDNAKELIAAYLDENTQAGNNRKVSRAESTEAEAKAKEALQSLGDLDS